jgi:hypothetical protein
LAEGVGTFALVFAGGGAIVRRASPAAVAASVGLAVMTVLVHGRHTT